ncbi:MULTISPECIES: DUF3313 domain-containing protein [unclassified Bradyrhizobium]|uniref:DUF3313 domain-containing protein n=1 Tax=unclassified Bradyrhizobium TaxID=2631580 RepID=UPI0028E89429|nr:MULTISPECIES: DUF3313 domain-containing protein [unclassified Bradyrhizobium]
MTVRFRAVGCLVIVAAGLCAGCNTVTPVAYSEVASARYLAPNTSDASGRMPYRYAAVAEWRSYDRIMLDPVVVYRGRDHQFADMSDQDKARLALYMRSRFLESLSARFQIVNQRGPNTLRVRLTLTGAVANTPVLGTASRFDLAGAVYNGVQTARDGEGLLTGSVFYAAEIFDAASGRLLKAFVSKQYPAPYDIKASVGALAAAEAGIDKGADALVAQLQ